MPKQRNDLSELGPLPVIPRQLDVAQDSVLAEELPLREAMFALAHARPAVPLGQWVAFLVLELCLADRHGQASTLTIAIPSRRMGALLADPEYPHAEETFGAITLDPLI